jgi:hypothetical protein
MYLVLHVKCQIISLRFKPHLDFLDSFLWKFPIQYFMEISPVVTVLNHADRRTDQQTDMI